MFNIVQEEQSLTTRVANQISQLIQDRQLKTGDRLPNEFELAQVLNVGRGTVREAVKQLVARNVLEIQRGRGTFVSKHPGRVDDPLGFNYMQNQQQLAIDLFEVRIVIEPWIASLAAEHATEHDIEVITRQCDLVEQQIQAGEDHLEEDVRLHTAIARASKNMAVPPLIPAVISRSVDLFGNLTNRSLLKETIETHREIVEAITAHDPERARAAMEKHLQYNEKRLRVTVMQE